MKVLLVVLFFAIVGISAWQGSPFVGVTQNKYQGNMTTVYYDKNGYDDAKEACNKEYNGTHVCTAAEVGLFAQFDSLYQGNYRYIDMSFGIDSKGGRQVNDCYGWTRGDDTFASHCILTKVGGPILPQFCSCSTFLPFACCQD